MVLKIVLLVFFLSYIVNSKMSDEVKSKFYIVFGGVVLLNLLLFIF